MPAAPDPLDPRLVTDLWFGRRDAWCRQHPGTGQFRAVTGTLTARTTARHLAGTVCLHSYCLTPPATQTGGGETCLWAAFDLDLKAPPDTPGLRRGTIRVLTRLHAALTRFVPAGNVLVEATGGRGLHLWVMFGAPVPAVTAVRLMDSALHDTGHTPAPVVSVLDGQLAVERNPRAALLTGRVGAALRVPFGVHPRTGNRSLLISPATGTRIPDPAGALRAITPVDPSRLAGHLPAPPPPAPAPRVAPPAPEAPGGQRPKPDAWLCYRHLADSLGLEGRTTRGPQGGATRHGVRCLFPERHAHQDRTGQGSAYLVRDHDTQLYGCSSCGVVFDTLQLLREALGVSFPEARQIAEAIDPRTRPTA